MKMELCHTYCTLYSTILLDVLLRVYKQNYVKMRTINTKLLWFRLFRGVYVYADQPLNNIGEKIKILSMDTQSTTSGLCHIKKKWICHRRGRVQILGAIIQIYIIM